ncbi:pyridoxamine 5'-phosphate oxidase [Sunxiuqinia sp. A32]|uniref:pyridoxamine 5'-phosphate oxidase n=1 Tax=Sunxiuqinia sp. A32 TaxID=3461496 RepID=UPI004045DE93
MLRDIRNNYHKFELKEDSLTNNPIDFFRNWMDDAIRYEVKEPTAMILATSTSGQPDARVVLLKEVRDGGFVFYTNYMGQKGLQLSVNPKVALTFFWIELERQVRIKGEVQKIGEQESTDYFATRPRDSQLGAWASKQSKEIESREGLEQQYEEFERRFEGEQIRRPDHWGGYLVVPYEIEFWQGRPNRLHDRIRYKLHKGNWNYARLQP